MLREEEDTLLAVEAMRLHMEALEVSNHEVERVGGTRRTASRGAGGSAGCNSTISRRHWQSAAAWQALAVGHTLPVDAWRATHAEDANVASQPAAAVTVTPMPIRMGW